MEIHRYDSFSGSRHLRIRPFGDLQFGAKGFRKDLWERWKRDALVDKESFLIGMGDYSDSFRPTIDKRITAIMADDRSAGGQLDDMVVREMSHIADMLKPFRNRIIGLLEGHHHHRLLSGVTSTQVLCQILKVKYLGFESVIRIGFCSSKKSKGSKLHANIVDIFATHGCGGSVYSASDLQNLERKIMPFWDCDIFLRGHSTKVYCVPGHPLNYLSSHEPYRIMQKNRLLVNTGGFMEGHIEGESTYVEHFNMPPCALGWAVIDVWHHKNGNLETSATPVVPPRDGDL